MDNEQLPFANRKIEDVPGHWLLARLGKRVLRPGGLSLTRKMLAFSKIQDSDVVEIAPGLGRTAREIIEQMPKSYIGVDADENATKIVNKIVKEHGYCVNADAKKTGLKDCSADVVIGEAMLTMQSENGKKQIISEALRILKPGGRYAIHELGLKPDDMPEEQINTLRKELAKAIKVNARPMTSSQWIKYLTDEGFKIDWIDTAPMALLKVRRNIADEGILGVFKILKNLFTIKGARKRVIGMRKIFQKNKNNLCGIAIVARKPE